MAKNLCVAIIFVICILLKSNNGTLIESEKCPDQSPCSCKIGDDEINISGIVLPSGGFLQDTEDNVTYFFSGCKDNTFNLTEHHIVGQNTSSLKGSLIKYTVGLPPKNPNVSNETQTSLEIIGSTADLLFQIEEKDSHRHYEIIFNIKNAKNLPRIELVCIDVDLKQSSALKIISSESDELALYSPLACPVKAHHGLSTGSILILIFFITLGIYFTVGAGFLYFLRGARGIEIIPHIEFFCELPGLVRDGVIFIFSGCKATNIATAETYDRI